MGDWEQFVGEITWFVPPGEPVEIGDEPRPWFRGPVKELPVLSQLLAGSTLTTVTVAGRSYELLAWGPSDNRRGWLCLPPAPASVDRLDPRHQDFLSVCGGIVERFGEPDSWWLNQDEILTETAARTALAPILDAYSWLWLDDDLEVPIDASEFYVVAVEANGNLTLVHRETSQLLLFAPDHAFQGVTPLPGCPEYSLMTLDRTPDLRTWIEGVAEAWSNA